MSLGLPASANANGGRGSWSNPNPNTRTRGSSAAVGASTFLRNSAREHETLVFQQEIIAWMAKLLNKPVDVNDLRNGSALCELLNRFAGTHIQTIYSVDPKVFHARANLDAAWEEMKRLGVPQSKVGAPDYNDVFNKEKPIPRLFLTGVLGLSRVLMDKFSVEPPELIRLDVEFERLRKEKREADARRKETERVAATYTGKWAIPNFVDEEHPYKKYKADESDPIDVAVSKICEAAEKSVNYSVYFSPQRVSPGEYVFGPSTATQGETAPPPVSVRIIQNTPFVWSSTVHGESLGSLLHQVLFLPTKKSEFVSELGAIIAKAPPQAATASIFEMPFKKAQKGIVRAPSVGRLPSASAPPLLFSVEEKTGVWAPSLAVVAGEDVRVSSLNLGDAPVIKTSVLPPEEVLARARMVTDPWEAASFELGYRWYKQSGGLSKHRTNNAQKKTYQAYIGAIITANSANAQSVILEDFAQIDLDVDRISAKLFRNPQLAEFLGKLESLDSTVHERVRNMLKASVIRNPHIGYVQGFHEIAFVLMGFMPEEPAFWTFNAMLEDCHINDFLVRNPPPMLGYQASAAALTVLAGNSFSGLRGKLRDGLPVLCELTTVSTWLSLYIDRVPFETLLCILDFFLRSEAGGICAIMRASLLSLQLLETQSKIAWPESSSSPESEAKEIYPELTKVVETLSADSAVRALSSSQWFTRPQLLTLIDQQRQKILEQYHHLETEFKTLIQDSPLSTGQINDLIASYGKIVGGDGGNLSQSEREQKSMVSKAQFKDFLKKNDVKLSDEAIDRLFQIYANSGGWADLRDLIAALIMLSAGQSREKLALCYSLFDDDKKGALLPSQANKCLTVLLKMLKGGALVTKGSGSKELALLNSSNMQLIPFVDERKLVPFDEFYRVVCTVPSVQALMTGPQIELIEDEEQASSRLLIGNSPLLLTDGRSRCCTCYGNRNKKSQDSSCTIS